MKSVWLLQDVTQSNPLFFVGYSKGTIIFSPVKIRGMFFESFHHANSSLTIEMKHQGIVARQHFLPINTNRFRSSKSSCGFAN